MNTVTSAREPGDGSSPALEGTSEIVSVQSDSRLLTSVISLGDQDKGTVGLLTRDAYRDYAKRGHVVAAVDQQDPSTALAYALFRISSSEVKLVHLVVSRSWQRQGLARRLVDHLSAQYPETRGITLKCKRSYDLGVFWQKLGFSIQGEVEGRGRDRAPLTIWHKSHGHDDLLTWTPGEAAGIPVLLDANVFYDYVSGSNDQRSLMTRSILDVELGEQIKLLVSPELRMEINRLTDPAKRKKLLRRVAAFPDLSVPLNDARRMANEILCDSGFSSKTRSQHQSDAIHIAFAILADIPYVVTRDNRLQRLETKLAQSGKTLDVEIVSLGQLVRLIDEHHDGDRYRPSSFKGTVLEVVEQNRAPTFLAEHHQNFSQGESKAHFVEIAESLMQDPASTLAEIVDPNKHAIGLLGYQVDNEILNVRLLRMAPSKLGHTVSRLILAELRSIAGSNKASVVRISDGSIGVFLKEAAIADSYSEQHDDSLVALCPNGSGTLKETESMVKKVEATYSWSFTRLRELSSQEPTVDSALELEHALRPYLVTDAGIDTYLVPIRQQWSTELLGVPEPGLWERQLGLGTSGEHVYYRAPTGNIQAPARIVWYIPDNSVTGSGTVARSYLRETLILNPQEAHKRFKRLGVYCQNDVLRAANRNRVQVLRFTGTQTLPSRMNARDLKLLAANSGVKPFFQGPWKMPASLFFELAKDHRA